MADVLMPRAGFTYRIQYDDKEVDHFNCVRVHGRRIYFGVTAWSCLCERTTRTKWRKMVDALIAAGGSITEQKTEAKDGL